MVAQTNAASAATEKASRKAWGMLVVIYLLSLSVPILWFSLPPMLADNTILAVFLGGDFSQIASIGNTMSVLSIGALVGAVFATFLVKKFSIKRTLVFGAILCIIGGALSALSAGTGLPGAGNFTFLLAARFIIGLGVGLVDVTSPVAITTWFPAKRRGLAMGIWATWVPVAIILSTNLFVNPLKSVFNTSVMGEYGLSLYSLPQISWWIMTAFILVCTILVAFVYKTPQVDTGVSAELKPIREILPFLKQHQLVMLAIVWLAFNYVNYCFTTYAPVYFAGGFSSIMDTSTAATWGSITSALGILAPLPAFVYDRLQRNKKWVLIMFGALVLTLTAVTGFRSELGPFSGWSMFILYLLCNAIANMILVGTIRPYVPLLVGRGGATAVTLGLSIVTFLQFFGQSLMSFCFGSAVAASGGQLISSANQLAFMPAEVAQASLNAWGIGCLEVVLPVAVIAFVCSLFLKPSELKQLDEKDDPAE